MSAKSKRASGGRRSVHDKNCFSEAKQNYYETLGYIIFATNCRGEEHFICDGGFAGWTQ